VFAPFVDGRRGQSSSTANGPFGRTLKRPYFTLLWWALSTLAPRLLLLLLQLLSTSSVGGSRTWADITL